VPTVTLLITNDGTSSLLPFPSGYPTPPPPWYNKIDEATANGDTDYIGTDETLNNYYNYFLKESLSLPVGATIDSVSIVANVRSEPHPIYPCTPTGRAGFYIGGVNYQHATAISPTSYWQDYERNFPTNPATGLAWTQDEVNNAEVFISGNSCRRRVVTVDYWSFYLVTQVHLIVYYTVAVAVTVRGDGLTWVMYAFRKRFKLNDIKSFRDIKWLSLENLYC